jgi:hypothetical protein
VPRGGVDPCRKRWFLTPKSWPQAQDQVSVTMEGMAADEAGLGGGRFDTDRQGLPR